MTPYAHRSQRGIALVTAMLVVAMAVTIAASLSLGQQIWIRQAQNLHDRSQLESMRHASLNWIGVLLVRDGKKKDRQDTLTDEWAKSFPPLPFDGGTMSVIIEDGQGRFNINTLHGAPEQIQRTATVFRNILANVGLDPMLTEAVIDWLDPDDETRPGGAEDTEYLNTGQPYRTGNQALTSIDELRLIQGFDAEAVEKLRPHVIALPTPTSHLNLNTVSDVVLASMYNNLTLEQAHILNEERKRRPWGTSAARFEQLKPNEATPILDPPFGYNTDYFLVRTIITYGRRTQSSLALIHRDTNSPQGFVASSAVPGAADRRRRRGNR